MGLFTVNTCLNKHPKWML